MGRITTDPIEKERILNLHLEATKRHYLKEQSSMEEVNMKKAVQCFLNKVGYKVKVDGMWGDESKKVLSQFQAKKGINDDGFWGPETFNSLNSNEKTIYKDCKSEHGDLLDKIISFVGLD
jgi:murein L,D-transpeptidase YcbB/YkuD